MAANWSQQCAGVNLDDIWSLQAWKCKWANALPNAVIYPAQDISTPPYVTKAPASATQYPYQPTQTDINAVIAQQWKDWVPGAIGANIPIQLPDREIDWVMLALLAGGVFLLTKVATR